MIFCAHHETAAAHACLYNCTRFREPQHSRSQGAETYTLRFGGIMDDDYSPLMHAIVDGSLRRVQTLLADDADDVHVCSTDGAGATPLHVAASEGQNRMVSLLLEKGADKDALDRDGGTPLEWAVDNGHLVVVETLLAAGAGINRRCHDWSASPFHYAAASGHDEIMSLLLKKGAEKDAPDKIGQTPLMRAVTADDPTIVKTLIAAGVDIRAVDVDGFMALHSAATFGRGEIASFLVEAGADKNAPDNDGITALMWAATSGKLPVVEALLAAGADPNIRRAADGDAALHRACRHGHGEIVSLLLQKGADKNARDNDGRTPLLSAVGTGCVAAVVEALLAADVDLTMCCNHDGRAALHVAAREGCNEVVSSLLEKGADKDARDIKGETPLGLAVESYRLNVVETLVAAGADVKIRSRLGGNRVLNWASTKGHVGIIQCVLRGGVDVDSCGRTGITALHRAARHDQAGAIAALLEAGADIELQASSLGANALLAATSTSASNAMLALLQRGAAVNVRDADGDTPLHRACRYQYRDTEALVELLLTWGADETALTGSGESPADLVDAPQVDFEECQFPKDAIQERVRVMLARAPADRAWRRRSWLVMVYSRVSKARVLGGESGAGGKDEEPTSAVSSVLGCLEQNGDLTSVVTSLLRLELEGVFRTVVSYL